MLLLLNITQLVLFIGLTCLVGCAILQPLVKAAGGSNVFHQLLCLLSRPFVAMVRRLVPRQVPDRAVAWLTLVLLVLAYAVVTIERANHCVTSQRLGQPGCR